MAAKKTAAPKASRKTAPARKVSRAGKTAPSTKRAGGKPRRESWKKALERNLIRVGYSPAEAKELVELAAA